MFSSKQVGSTLSSRHASWLDETLSRVGVALARVRFLGHRRVFLSTMWGSGRLLSQLVT